MPCPASDSGRIGKRSSTSGVSLLSSSTALPLPLDKDDPTPPFKVFGLTPALVLDILLPDAIGCTVSLPWVELRVVLCCGGFGLFSLAGLNSPTPLRRAGKSLGVASE